MKSETANSEERTAYRIAALPPEYQDTQITELFTRGYDRYRVDGEYQADDLLDDVEQFGTAAFKSRVRTSALDDPFVDEPATLAVLATLSAICVKSHSMFEDTPPRRIQPLYDIRELYVNNLASLLREYADPTLYQEIAELLYGKEDSEDGPHPGRVCTAITEKPEFGGGLYLEIPMAAASRKCLVRATSTETGSNTQGEILTRIANNHLYVPVGDFDRKYRSYAEQAFKKLLRVQENEITEEQRTWLTTNESAISEQLERFQHAGHTERLWRDWQPGQRLIRVVRAAVRHATDEHAETGEYHTAEELYNALESYDTDSNWEQTVIDSISSPSSLAKSLTDNESHPAVTVDRDGTVNRYRIGYASRSSQRLDIETIDDVFQLPCLAAMESRLHEEKPVRKDLYSFVRLVMWLPHYHNRSLDAILADLKDIFSRWPWYDEEITEYQIRYEFSNTIDGDPPLPMNCDNDDLQRYCIGQDQCPYSIWGSLPFPEQMYGLVSNKSNQEMDPF